MSGGMVVVEIHVFDESKIDALLAKIRKDARVAVAVEVSR